MQDNFVGLWLVPIAAWIAFFSLPLSLVAAMITIVWKIL